MAVIIIMLLSTVPSFSSDISDKTFPVIRIVPGESHVFSPVKYIYFNKPDKEIRYSFSSDGNFKITGNINKLKLIDIEKKQGLFNFRIKILKKDKILKFIDIPVIIKNDSRKVNFIYSGKAKNQKVFLAGSMNNWKSGITKLSFNKKTEQYETLISLPYGIYSYKYVVDNNWIIDPDNTEQISDGLGGFNSQICVGDPAKNYEPSLLYLTKDITLKKINLIFQIKHGNPEPSDTIIYYNNSLLQSGRDYEIDRARNKLILKINKHTPDRPVDKLRIIVYGNNPWTISSIYSYDYQRFGYFDYKDSIIYNAITDRFNNGDPKNDDPVFDSELTPSANFHGGDYKGLTEKIKNGYFSDLGINVLWISPQYQNPYKAYREFEPPHRKFSGYHGYWPIHNFKVDSRLGNMQDLKKLVAAAHGKNIKVLLDYVANHVHEENPVYQNRRRWFIGSKTKDGRENIKLFDEFPLTTWFDTFLPKFNFSNPEVRKWLVDQAVWWLKNTGADGLRLDAVKHIPDIFWMELRNKLSEYDKNNPYLRTFMIGETIDNRKKVMSYIDESKLDAQFDFSFYWIIRDVFAVGSASMRNLEREHADYRKQLENGLLSAFIGNHDFPRFMSYADDAFIPGDSEEKIRAWKNRPQTTIQSNYWKWRLGMTFIMSINGCPLVYYGDEIGLQGAWDPDNRRDMKFDDKLSKIEKENLDFLSKLNKCRLQNSSLRRGAFYTLYLDDDVWVYLRNHFNNNALVVINRKDEKVKVKIHLPDFIDTGKLNSFKNGEELKITEKGTIIIPAQSSDIYVDNKNDY